MAAVEAMSSRATSDERYVLDLCGQVLGQVCERQKRFDFLGGDPGNDIGVDMRLVGHIGIASVLVTVPMCLYASA